MYMWSKYSFFPADQCCVPLGFNWNGMVNKRKQKIDSLYIVMDLVQTYFFARFIK